MIRRPSGIHHSSFRIHHSPRGFSLLEVLVSMFVLMMGLVGVAALIPIGKVAMSEANTSDRTGACGRAALREIKIRRMLDWLTGWNYGTQYQLGVVILRTTFINGVPYNHYYQCIQAGISTPWSNPLNPPTWPNGGTVTEGSVTWRDLGDVSLAMKVFVIDPLALAVNPQFPLNLGGKRLQFQLPNNFNAPQNVMLSSCFPLPRISLNWLIPNLLNPQNSLAESIFRLQDELTFERPPTASGRPRGYVRIQDSKGNQTLVPCPPFPVLQSGESYVNNDNVPKPQNDAGFSWFMTVSPTTNQTNLFWTSVVVCHKRKFTTTNEGTPSKPDIEPDGERAIDIPLGGFLSLGIGGGTIQLSPQISVKGQFVPVNSSSFPLKKNQWVMLCGWVQDDPNNPTMRIPIACQWYRVVGVGTDNSPPYISLDGPDWPVMEIPHVTLVVVDGVTGVYTTTTQLEDIGIWTK